MADLAIIIPTLDRTEFLKRSMRWYSRPECHHLQVIVVDSTPDGNRRSIHDKIVQGREQEAGGRTKYFETPDYYDDRTNTSAFGRALELGGEYAYKNGSEYIMHAGDDDFVIPEGIGACVRKVKDAPSSVVGCVGARMRFGMTGAWGVPVTSLRVDYPNLADPRPAERLASWVGRTYTVQFAATRAEAWVKAHRGMEHMPTWYWGNEIYPNAHLLFQGKFIPSPHVSVAFQVNPKRQFGFDTWSMYDLVVKDPNFSKTMAEARERLRVDFGDDALDLFDRQMQRMLSTAMARLTGNLTIDHEGMLPVDPPEGMEDVWNAMQEPTLTPMPA